MPDLRPISAIQGASHLSPLLGRQVATEGVVTALAAEGFYLQDPVGDGDPATSEGIFVAAERPGALEAGDRIRIHATVVESAPDGSPAGLPVTRLTLPSAIEVLARGNPLPRPVVLGAGGRSIPRGGVIAPADLPVDLRDAGQAQRNRFTPDSDVLDFFEALEGMLVTLRAPTALSPTERRGGGRSDVFTHPEPGQEAGDRHARTAAGGTLLRSGPENLGDQNPDRIRIAFDPMLLHHDAPVLAVGDRLGDVTGVTLRSPSSPGHGGGQRSPYSRGPRTTSPSLPTTCSTSAPTAPTIGSARVSPRRSCAA